MYNVRTILHIGHVHLAAKKLIFLKIKFLLNSQLSFEHLKKVHILIYLCLRQKLDYKQKSDFFTIDNLFSTTWQLKMHFLLS